MKKLYIAERENKEDPRFLFFLLNNQGNRLHGRIIKTFNTIFHVGETCCPEKNRLQRAFIS